MMAHAQQVQPATDRKLSNLFLAELLERPYGGTDAPLNSRCFRFLHLQHVSAELRISPAEFFPVFGF